MAGYLRDELWLRSSRMANDRAAHMVAGLRAAGAGVAHPPQANLIFPRLPRATHQRLHDAGAVYHIWEGALDGPDPEEPLTARLVCDWSVTEAEIDQVVEYLYSL